jgi:uncharacterized repeat protein (TIGR03803 family)
MLRYKTFVLVAATFVLCAAPEFALATDGEKILHTFYDEPAANPRSNLISDAEGNLYGSTVSSGLEACKCGTVFRLSPQAGGGWSYKVLYQFQGEEDGGYPTGKLVFDKTGKLYGAMAWGDGGVFQLTQQPDGSWAEIAIYAFTGAPDGSNPYSGLTIDNSGNLYGTTQSGGANGIGCVYMVSPTANGWSETVLHSFSGSDGAYPWADVTLDAAGNVYGATIAGGAYGQGAVFELYASHGSWTETVLYSFRGGTHHGWPAAGVYLDASGKIFGTLSDNGDGGLPGAVFRLEPNSNGKWTETLLHTFGKRGDGGFPWSDLVPDAAGNLYGTTYVGGNTGNGVIYKLTRNANGNWTESVFFSFNYRDGASPVDNPVTFDAAGNLFVATFYGGLHGGYDGNGVVLELAP